MAATKTARSRSSKSKASSKKSSSSNRCWAGYEPVPGKRMHEQGSCKPKSGTKSKKKSTSKS